MRAVECGLACCEVCHHIVKMPSTKKGVAICPRCKEEVHYRKKNSLEHTWALVIASMIFYIPANLLPIMHVHTFAGTQSDTIISGVIYFLETGSYLIASVIFIASIIVPLTKLMILIYLLLSVQFKKGTNKDSKMKLYRLTELIGKWSMVDVYVVAIMISLVHFGGLSNIQAGEGANYFLVVVILTMIGAMRFDARLIWDIRDDDATRV
jgi:paraquat-inducible protein A